MLLSIVRKEIKKLKKGNGEVVNEKKFTQKQAS